MVSFRCLSSNTLYLILEFTTNVVMRYWFISSDIMPGTATGVNAAGGAIYMFIMFVTYLLWVTCLGGVGSHCVYRNECNFSTTGRNF